MERFCVGGFCAGGKALCGRFYAWKFSVKRFGWEGTLQKSSGRKGSGEGKFYARKFCEGGSFQEKVLCREVQVGRVFWRFYKGRFCVGRFCVRKFCWEDSI